MVVVIGILAVVGAILFWILRASMAVRAVRELDEDTRGVRRRIKHAMQDMVGTPLGRVNDPRLAAAILMIQLVRAEGHMVAEEKTAILDVLEMKLGVSEPGALFEKAWSYTHAGHAFSSFADELLPLLQRQLTFEECRDLLAMLQRIADAEASPSELQSEAITRLRKRLRA